MNEWNTNIRPFVHRATDKKTKKNGMKIEKRRKTEITKHWNAMWTMPKTTENLNNFFFFHWNYPWTKRNETHNAEFSELPFWMEAGREKRPIDLW